MNKSILSLALVVLALPLPAETAGWAGYVSYGTKPVATDVALRGKDLSWVRDVAALIPAEGFTFLARRDADHWMALSDKGAFWLLQIHDETAQYNLRARIAPTSGRLTVEKGVDWTGMAPAADAAQAAELAVGYVQKARSAGSVFSAMDHSAMDHGTAAAHDPAPDSHAAPAAHGAATDAHGAANAHDAPAAHAAAATMENTAVGTGGTELWQKLVDGNLRFVSGKVTRPNQSMARVEETAKGQHPFAIVVSCSDSRVPPEVLFDQGIGDLFVVRTAGEVVTEVELGSIEYAIEHLGATYLVVMGHKKCGAVDATLKGGDVPPNIAAIAAQIRPAVEAAKFFKGDALDNTVRENAKQILAKLKGDDIIAEALHAGKLNVKAAYYDIDTGKVSALP